MKALSKTEAELKNSVAYKKCVYFKYSNMNEIREVRVNALIVFFVMKPIRHKIGETFHAGLKCVLELSERDCPKVKKPVIYLKAHSHVSDNF